MLRNLELVGVSGLTFRVQTSSKRSVRGWYRRDPVLVAFLTVWAMLVLGPGVVPLGRFSCVYDPNADGLSCPLGRVCMAYGGGVVSVEGTLSLESSGTGPVGGDGRVVIAAVVVICGGGL